MLERMPADAQDGVACAVLNVNHVLEINDCEPEQRPSVAEGLEQASRGELAVGSDFQRTLVDFEGSRPHIYRMIRTLFPHA